MPRPGRRLLGGRDASGVDPAGLALGGAGGFGGEGGGLLQRGAVEFERCGNAEGVALAAANGPAGGECRPDGLVTNVGEVVGEQARQVEGDLRVRLLLGGRTWRTSSSSGSSRAPAASRTRRIVFGSTWCCRARALTAVPLPNASTTFVDAVATVPTAARLGATQEACGAVVGDAQGTLAVGRAGVPSHRRPDEAVEDMTAKMTGAAPPSR